MRVFIDTNILISAALSSSGTPFKAYCKAVSYPNDAIICEQNIDELPLVTVQKRSVLTYAPSLIVVFMVAPLSPRIA